MAEAVEAVVVVAEATTTRRPPPDVPRSSRVHWVGAVVCGIRSGRWLVAPEVVVVGFMASLPSLFMFAVSCCCVVVCVFVFGIASWAPFDSVACTRSCCHLDVVADWAVCCGAVSLCCLASCLSSLSVAVAVAVVLLSLSSSCTLVCRSSLPAALIALSLPLPLPVLSALSFAHLPLSSVPRCCCLVL